MFSLAAPSLPPATSAQVVFLVRPVLALMDTIAAYIKQEERSGGSGVRTEFRVVFVPRESLLCRKRLVEVNTYNPPGGGVCINNPLSGRCDGLPQMSLAPRVPVQSRHGPALHGAAELLQRDGGGRQDQPPPRRHRHHQATGLHWGHP